MVLDFRSSMSVRNLEKWYNDKTAFYAFVDRFTSEASSATFPMAHSPEEIEEVAHLIEQKVRS